MNHEIAMKDNLEMLRSVNVQSVDRDTLVDICSVEIDETKPVEQRVRGFLEQIKNPYCFRVGKVVVKVEFSQNGKSFEENFEKMLMVL